MDFNIDLQYKKIKIVSDIVSIFNSYKQLGKKDLEAGGILIGRESRDTGNLIIEYATMPFEKDKRTRYSFHRRDKMLHGKLIPPRKFTLSQPNLSSKSA